MTCLITSKKVEKLQEQAKISQLSLGCKTDVKFVSSLMIDFFYIAVAASFGKAPKSNKLWVYYSYDPP